jgi:menaquinone-dependent protoporphyrinogen oxidase
VPKRVLILYGTTEGQTAKVASFVADRLKQKGIEVTLVDAAHTEDAAFSGYDGALVAASLHAGGFQKSVLRLVDKQAEALAAIPNAFLSVSLSAAGDDAADWKGLEKCLDEFFAQAGWRPQRIEHVAGAFRYTKYDFFKRMAMKHIAQKRDAPVDTSRDWEMTDWDKLSAFADTFAHRLTG